MAEVKQITNQCTARRQNGQPCRNSAINGSNVCRMHGGAIGHVKRKALVRATLQEWGLSDTHVDPGEVLLRLVSQSAQRASWYGELLRQAYEAAEMKGEQDEFSLPNGVKALIGKRYSVTEGGGRVEIGEAITGLVQLEMQERKLCADFATRAIAAGLAERQVRVAEAQGTAIIGAIMAALDRAGVVGPARLEAQNAASDYLMALTS